jgi:predicted nucleic-acid-binding protein
VYNVNPDQIRNGVEMLLDHKDLVVQDADVVKAAIAHYRKHPRLGFSDCLILEVARAAGHLPLGTFDRGLGELPGAQKP